MRFRRALQNAVSTFLESFIDIDLLLVATLAVGLVTLTHTGQGRLENYADLFVDLILGSLLSFVSVVLATLFLKTFFALLLHVWKNELPLRFVNLTCAINNEKLPTQLEIVIFNKDEYYDGLDVVLSIWRVGADILSEDEEKQIYEHMSRSGRTVFWENGQHRGNINRLKSVSFVVAVVKAGRLILNIAPEKKYTGSALPPLKPGKYAISIGVKGKTHVKAVDGSAQVTFSFDEKSGISGPRLVDFLSNEKDRDMYRKNFWFRLFWGRY